MRSFLLVFAVLLTTLLGNVHAADTLTIVHVNDTHSNLAPGGRRNSSVQGTLGGIARAATYIGRARAASPDLLVLHAGDMSIGDLFYQKYFGVAELRLMSALGFDAMTLGNHEFDLTPATLLSACKTAFAEGQSFAILSANTDLEAAEVAPLKQYVTASVVKNVGSMKIGIFGLTTPETNLLSQPQPAFIDTNIVEIAQQQTNSLRAAGCNVVILLSHLGNGLDGIVSQYVRGIDLIVGGHDHREIAADPASSSTPIVQAGAFFHTIGKVELEYSNGKVRLLSSSIDSLDTSIPEEPSVVAMVNEMIADIETTYGPVYTQQIATATDDIEQLATGLTEMGAHDTPLGNEICDAFRNWGKTEIAIEPGGSVAQNLYRGPLVSVDAFRAISYGFNLNNGLGYRMARFTVLGSEIMKGVEFGLADLSNDEFMSQVSGMTYSYNPANPPYGRLVDITVGGQTIDPARRYSVTANEFVVMFFGVLGITPGDIDVETDSTEFMVLAAHLLDKRSVSPVTDGRIRATNTTTAVDAEPSSASFLIARSVSGQVVIDVDCPSADNITIELYTADLRRVEPQYTVSTDDDNLHVECSTDGLGSGTYIIKLQVGECVHVGRIIVVK